MRQIVKADEAAAMIAECFETLPEPRVEGRVVHDLITVIGTALIGTICGALSFRDMARYTALNLSFLSDYFDE